MKTFFLFLIFIFTTSLFSTIINVPTDQPTIQDGINASANSDTVLVQPGTYIENINYNGKLITVASLFLTTQDTIYISQTIIDGNQNDSVVIFETDEDSTAVLAGFTIANGHAYQYDHGGGIRFWNANASLANLIVTGNIADGLGGGIFCIYNSNPNIKNVLISENIAFAGGGICLNEDSNPSLINVTIAGNSADYSGGIRCVYSSPSLENVTITNNSSISWGNGISCHLNSNPSLINCILWNDTSEEIVMQSGGDPNSITISYSDIQGGEAGIVTNNNGTVNWLVGNIDEDPLFVDPLNGNFHLTENSPCIDAGDPTSPLDPDGTIADMGAFYYNQSNSYFGSIWHVSTAGSDSTGNGSFENPFASIQHGINIAVDADTVLVQPGTYVENINYNGKNITVASLFLTIQDTIYISQTIIDGNQNGSVVAFENSEDSTTVLCGFTIINGLGGGSYPDCYAGGITCNNSSNPNLENLIITSNSAIHGGGIFCSASNPSLMNVTISENTAEDNGGGIFCFSNSNPSLVNVTITGNSAGGGDGGGINCQYSSSPSLMNVTISENFAVSEGGGINCSSTSDPSLVNVTITGNTAGNHGGGINLNNNSNLNLTNCILWSDSPQEINCYQGNDPNSITISYSDIQGGEAGIVTNNNGTVNWLDGNIDEYPLFVDPLNGDYHLTVNSPCIDAGDPNFPLDPDNTICDMGAFYYHQDQYIVVEEIYPEPGIHTISEGDSINFYISASDPDGNTIEYNWELDNELVSIDSCYTFYTDENSAGDYEVTLSITDNYQPPFRNELNFEWNIVVEDGVVAQEFLPLITKVYQNYPNPFNPSTTINYQLQENGLVEIFVYNLKGQKVKQFVNEQLSAGQHSVVWNGKDDNGKSVSSGIYFYKLKSENYEKTKKMILLK